MYTYGYILLYNHVTIYPQFLIVSLVAVYVSVCSFYEDPRQAFGTVADRF